MGTKDLKYWFVLYLTEHVTIPFLGPYGQTPLKELRKLIFYLLFEVGVTVNNFMSKVFKNKPALNLTFKLLTHL